MISVIIPALNEEAFIERTLASARAQPEGCEVIVVDNGSADRTVDLAQRWAIVTTSAPGRGTAMNAGAALATGDVFLFLHADTVLPPGALAEIDRALADERVVGGCFSITFDGRDWRSALVGALYSVMQRAGYFYGDAGIFVRRSVFEALGGYAPLVVMEDLDFCQRLRRAGRTVRVPLSVVSSSRRWERQGFLKTTLVYLAIQGPFLLGVRWPWLLRLYSPVR